MESHPALKQVKKMPSPPIGPTGSQKVYSPDEIIAQQRLVSSLKDDVETAKKNLEQAKNDLNTMIQKIDYIPTHKLSTLIFTLYWRSSARVPTLKELAKERTGHLKWQDLIQGKMDWRCDGCGNVAERIFKNKTELNDTRRGIFLCESCKEERLEKERASIEAWKRQQQEEAGRLAELKAMPYSEYLKTPEWQAIRKSALKRARYACQLCGAENVPLHVHHKSYDRIGHEHTRDLIVLCADCHTKFHDKEEKPDEEKG